MTDPYFWLVQKIADAEPNSGYDSPDQIALEPADIPVVVEKEPGLVSDAFDDWTDKRIVSEILPALKSGDDLELGRIFRRELKELCERQVYLPVSDECDRRDEITFQEREQRRAADAASVRAYGEL